MNLSIPFFFSISLYKLYKSPKIYIVNAPSDYGGIYLETRKVQVIGGSTFTVSLPKKWAVEQKLKHGDNMYLWPQLDGSMVLRTEGSREAEPGRLRKFKIDSFEPEHLLRELIGSYISGFELIELSAVKRISPELREIIREFIRITIGPEIIDESLNKIVLQDFIDPSELSLKKGVRRMYLIAKSMHTDALTAFKERNTELANDIISRDAEVDRFFWLISKQFNLVLTGRELRIESGMRLEDSMDYYLVARIIERIADHAGKISENIIHLGKNKIPAGNVRRLNDIHKHYLDMLEMATLAFFNSRSDEANKAIDRTMELHHVCDSSLSETLDLDSSIAISVAYIIESMRRTGMYATDISEIAINHIVSKSVGSRKKQ